MRTQQLRRWKAARALFYRLKAAGSKSDVSIYYEGEIITAEDISITEEEINILIGDCIVVNWFTTDPALDHGLYNTIPEYEKQVRERFFVIKKVSW